MNIREIEKVCPLCGEDNNCQHNKDCWCHAVIVPHYIIAMIPTDKKEKACICNSCIDKYKREL